MKLRAADEMISYGLGSVVRNGQGFVRARLLSLCWVGGQSESEGVFKGWLFALGWLWCPSLGPYIWDEGHIGHLLAISSGRSSALTSSANS